MYEAVIVKVITFTITITFTMYEAVIVKVITFTITPSYVHLPLNIWLFELYL